MIDDEGNFLGSVSGGCVEGAVVDGGLDVIADGAPRMLEFGVADETAWRVGLSCGGRIKVYVEKARLMRLDVLKAMNAARRDAPRRRDPGHPNFRRRSAVRRGRGGRRRSARRAELEAALRIGQKRRRSIGQDEEYFLTVQAPAPRLVLVGAVHICQALAPIARIAGLDVSIIDPRTAFATPERFPDTPVIAKWPDEALDRRAARPLHRDLPADPRPEDRRPRADRALNAECFYIGALGSRKTHAKRLERMRAKGFDEAALARIHAPIGLDIGAVSPAEIAVSIIGEIVAALRKKPLRAESAAA